MNDFTLKIVLSILGGIVFSFIFIIIALTVPVKKDKKVMVVKKPKGKLEIISHSLQNK